MLFMEDIIQLQRLSDEATDYILKRHGRLFPYCSQGAARLRTLARKEGIKLKKVGGLYGFNQHWWCETEDGVRIDPTAGQFGKPNGVQTLYYENYDPIPTDLVIHLPHRDWTSSARYNLQDAWASWKLLMAAGAPTFETRGEDKREERVDKKGWPYLYESRKVEFSWNQDKQERARVTWTKTLDDGSILQWGFITWTRRFVAKDKTVKYQTYQTRFKKLVRNGLHFEKIKGKFQLEQ